MICQPFIKISHLIKNCMVALAAGGEGSRLKNVTEPFGVHKAAFVLPNGQTMIERTILMYRDLGITEFVALVFNKADSVKNLLGDGSRYGVRITYSYDPKKPVGRGGAIKNALRNNKIDKTKYLIVHNPDDQIVGNRKKILTNVISQHLSNEEKGALASAVVVAGSYYHYSGIKIDNDKVVEIEMYPFISIPAHIGMTIFSPRVFPYFDQLFDLNKKTDFESVLFPALKNKDKLYACRIPVDSWIPVNDEKGLKKLIEKL